MIVEIKYQHKTKSQRDDMIVISPFQGLVILSINTQCYNNYSPSGLEKN